MIAKINIKKIKFVFVEKLSIKSYVLKTRHFFKFFSSFNNKNPFNAIDAMKLLVLIAKIVKCYFVKPAILIFILD
jgi:hypothetical protein